MAKKMVNKKRNNYRYLKDIIEKRYIFLISEYVKRITKNDIKRFALKEGITLTEFEVNIINEYIKNYYKTFK